MEGQKAPTLHDAKLALQRAVDVDEESPRSLIELGHFLNAVEDNAEEAAKCLAKTVRLAKRLLKEALLGQAKVLAELDRRTEAFACLTEAYWLQSRNGKFAHELGEREILKQLDRRARFGRFVE